MANASRDQNRVTTLMGVSDADGTTLLPIRIDPATNRVLASTSGGSFAPTSATYVTLTTNATLTNERVLTGTSNQITITDNGAGSTVVLSFSNGVTGSGAVVLATSPTLTTPNLGTPSSVTLTNATGLPVATGISGLGAGVADFLATPSSANLAAAVTGETGSGALVFATSPTLVTPTLGVATATSVNGLTITATTGTLTLANGSSLITSGANSITLTSTGATNVTLPTSGTLATVGGGNTQVMFNDSGVLGGDSGLTYNKTTNELSFQYGITESVYAATGNSIDMQAGAASTNGEGKNVSLFASAGDPTSVGNLDGGSVFLTAGAKRNSGTNGRVKMVLGSGGGQANFSLDSITAGQQRTITIPDATGTMVLADATQELDNKTLDSSVGKGTWTASGTWTLPAVTMGGAVTFAGNATFNDNAILTFSENTRIVLDPALSADGKYCGITEAGNAGETLAFGDLIYFKAADSKWWLTDADADSTSGAVRIAMCLNAASANDGINVLLWGKIRADAAFPSLTIGAPAYVSTTAGDIQTTKPSGTDDVVRVVGYGNTADELFFCPSNDYITVV